MKVDKIVGLNFLTLDYLDWVRKEIVKHYSKQLKNSGNKILPLRISTTVTYDKTHTTELTRDEREFIKQYINIICEEIHYSCIDIGSFFLIGKVEKYEENRQENI